MLCGFIQAIIVAGLLSGTAYAQIPSGSQSSIGIPLKSDRPLTQEEIEQKNAADRDYQSAMHKIPDKKASSDPWGTIRPATPASSKAKQPQPQ